MAKHCKLTQPTETIKAGGHVVHTQSKGSSTVVVLCATVITAVVVVVATSATLGASGLCSGWHCRNVFIVCAPEFRQGSVDGQSN